MKGERGGGCPAARFPDYRPGDWSLSTWAEEKKVLHKSTGVIKAVKKGGEAAHWTSLSQPKKRLYEPLALPRSDHQGVEKEEQVYRPSKEAQTLRSRKLKKKGSTRHQGDVLNHNRCATKKKFSKSAVLAAKNLKNGGSHCHNRRLKD